MPRRARANPWFICSCGCGKRIKDHDTERAHLKGKGPLAVRLWAASQNREPSLSPPLSLRASSSSRPPSPFRTPSPSRGTSMSPPPSYEMDIDMNDIFMSNEARDMYDELEIPPLIWSHRGDPDNTPSSSSSSDDTESEPEVDWESDKDNDDAEWASYWDREDDHWDWGEKPWQKGLSEAEKMGAEFDKLAAQAANLSPKDLDDVWAFNYKVDMLITDEAFKKLPKAFPSLSKIDSLYKLQRRMVFLSGVTVERYDCCIDSCMCFTGQYKDLDRCAYCHKPRFDGKGKPVKQFQYLPLLPRLIARYASKDRPEKSYGASYTSKPGFTRDIWDGEHMRRLRQTYVELQGENLGHKFFSDLRDIILGLSLDGFGPFKRKNHTSWPLILIDYSLSPEVRFQLENIFCVGAIPGPKQMKDLDSYLYPLVMELLHAARGVRAYDALKKQVFALHVYLVLVFGDIPAIAKAMCMKGHNSYSPCRFCTIKGISAPNNHLYAALQHPDGSTHDPLNLPMRTHDLFMEQARHIDALPRSESKKVAKEYGIHGASILSLLPSISFPTSFPYDFMHMVWENVVKMLLQLWCGQKKGLDEGTGDYHLGPTVADALGKACKKSGDHIPAAFGPRVPHIVDERWQFTADTWSLWTLALGPVLLRKRFKNKKYYTHFIALVKLLYLCLQLEISDSDIDKIEVGMAAWVTAYERHYYQGDRERLSVCTLPLHALLHLAHNIRTMGPSWCYWAYPMERFCGSLLPAIKSRRFPFASIDRRIVELAYIYQIKVIYGLRNELDLRRRSTIETTGFTPSPAYSEFVLVFPKEERTVDMAMRKRIAIHLASTYGLEPAQHRELLPHIESRLDHWGKVQWLNGGNMIHARDMGQFGNRDMSYVKFNLPEDVNSPLRFGGHYGQLRLLLIVDLPPLALIGSVDTTRHVLAVVAPCRLVSVVKDLEMPTTKGAFKALRVIDACQIKRIAGRVADEEDGTFTFIEQSGCVQVLHANDDPERAQKARNSRARIQHT